MLFNVQTKKEIKPGKKNQGKRNTINKKRQFFHFDDKSITINRDSETRHWKLDLMLTNA